MRMKDILVIVPVFNEEKNIKKVIEELRRDLQEADILVIDDGSCDKTLNIIKKLNVDYVSLPFNLGYSAALQTGYIYASKKHYSYVIQFDGDGQHIAIEAKKLIDYIKKLDVDILIGSRFRNKNYYRHPFLKKIGTKIFQYIIKIITKVDITDPTSGFQILNKKIISEYARMNNFPEYPDANLIIEMIFKGYKIGEISTIMNPRKHGKGMYSGIYEVIKYFIKLFNLIFVLTLHYKIFNGKR